jgi:iron complex outermembrane receptor protein
VLGTPATVGRDFTNDDDISETGLFAQARVTLFDRLRLSGGVRRDEFESENRYVDNITRGTARQTTRIEDTNTSWRVGASADLSEQVSLFTGASRNFVPQTGRLRAGNAAVPALRATSHEAGVKAARLLGGLSGTLSLFRITQANQTVADAANRPGESFVEIVGTVRSQGVEAELSAEFGAGLSLLAGGSYLDSKIRTRGSQLGNRFFNTPEWDGFVRATYAFEALDLPDVSASLGVVHTGDRFGNNANSFVLPAYTRVDAGLYYDGPRFGARVSVENLFDEVYYLGSQNRAQNIAPGAPRFVTVGASVKC